MIGTFGTCNRNKNNDEDLIMSDVCSNVVVTLLLLQMDIKQRPTRL